MQLTPCVCQESVEHIVLLLRMCLLGTHRDKFTVTFTILETRTSSLFHSWSVFPSVDMRPFGVTIPASVPQRSEIPEGLTYYPVVTTGIKVLLHNFPFQLALKGLTDFFADLSTSDVHIPCYCHTVPFGNNFKVHEVLQNAQQ